MRRSLLFLVGGTLAVAACNDNSTPPTQPLAASVASDMENWIPSQPVLFRGNLPGVRSQDVVPAAGPINYHAGGPVQHAFSVVAIYWGTSTIYNGGPAPGTKGPGSADGSLVGKFLNSIGGTPYYNINTTYYDSLGGIKRPVLNSVTYRSFYANNVNVPPANGSTVTNTQIRQAIARSIQSHNVTFDTTTIYMVFTAGNTNLGGGFGSQYCAYHGFFVNPNNTSQFLIYAAMPFDQQFPFGCTSQFPSPNNDLGGDREMPATVHELEEAHTDYKLNAWFDASGQENADKCAFNWGVTYTTGNGGTANVNINGIDYLIQQNWIARNGGCALHFP